MPTPVATSVMTMVRITPYFSASTPQKYFPAMPPINTSGTASAAQPLGTPLAISKNAIKVRKPVRVPLSTISTMHSAANAGLLRMPQPGVFTFGLAAVCVWVLAIQKKITTAVMMAATPNPTTGACHEMPASTHKLTIPPKINLPTSPAKL